MTWQTPSDPGTHATTCATSRRVATAPRATPPHVEVDAVEAEVKGPWKSHRRDEWRLRPRTASHRGRRGGGRGHRHPHVVATARLVSPPFCARCG
jgi:hypothetical protein